MFSFSCVFIFTVHGVVLAVDNAAYPRSASIIYFSPLRSLTVNPMMGATSKGFLIFEKFIMASGNGVYAAFISDSSGLCTRVYVRPIESNDSSRKFADLLFSNDFMPITR